MKVSETELSITDTRQQYREKIARITLDSMVQFVGLLDAKGLVLEINQVALTAVGIKLSDVEGLPFWETFWWQVSDEINAKLKSSIAQAALGEFVRWDTPIYGRAGGKETIIIDASLYPVLDDRGKVVFICAEGRDITEKQKHEHEMAAKNIELEGLVAQIRELDEIRTQFFANISHELRTPLALIIGPAERLIDTEHISTPEVQRDAAQVIVRNARMLLKHVNDLLDLSKLDAGKLKLHLRETDLTTLISYIASHFDLLANERGIHFEVDLGTSVLAAVDPEKMQRVAMNLLSNAFKFAPDGGAVRCKLEQLGTDLVLSIEDSGPGVKPELREVIFERFRQGDGGVNRQFSGTGLGLAIANEFIEMHKGTIVVLESGLGGAMFKAVFPVTHLSFSDQSTIPPETQSLDRSTLENMIEELRKSKPNIPGTISIWPELLNKEVVLVVEDNHAMSGFITECLSQNYHVISAYDGKEGLEKALAFNPSLIVSDIMMPGVSGVQMIDELRKRPEMNDTPILLLSAKADEELKNQLLLNSAQDFVTKPFKERDLLVRIHNLIAVRRSREALREAERKKRQIIESANRDLLKRSKQLSDLFEQAPSFMAVLRGPDYVFEFANEAYF